MENCSNTIFQTQLSRGRKGELVVSAALFKRGWEVVDVTKLQNYQKKDIDFRIHKNDVHLSIEVKTDRYISSTSNFVIEQNNTANLSHNGLGWFHYTEADILAYVCEHTHNIFTFNVDDMKQYLSQGGTYEQIVSTFSDGNTVVNWLVDMNNYQAAGYLIQHIV